MRLLFVVLIIVGLFAWLLLTPRVGDAPDVAFAPEPAGPGTPSIDHAITAPSSVQIERAAAPELTARPDAPVLPAPGTPDVPERVLRGLVTDGEDGPPLPDVEFAICPARSPRESLTSVVTDAEGRFETVPLPCSELSLRQVPDPEIPDRAVAYWTQPGVFTLPPAVEDASGAPFEATFWVTRPSDVILVDVFEANGSPAVGARAQLRFTSVDPKTGSQLSTGGATETNSRGRAYLGLWDSAGLTEGTLFARLGDERVSDVIEVDAASYRGPHRLVLGPASALLVNAHWPFGDAAVGHEVQLHGPRDYAWPGEKDRSRGVTDGEGLLWFRGLYPAEYTAFVLNPRTQGRDRGTATLGRGEAVEVLIELEEGKREIAAQGSVVDEDGAPLPGVQIIFRADERWAEEATTDANGEFECWAEPSDAVWIALGTAPGSDVYEPGSRSVLFGERGVVFARVARAQERRFQVRATDRATGMAVEPLYLTFDQGADRDEWSNSYAPRETYVVEATAATRCKVASPGYVGTTFVLFDAVAAAQGDPPLIEVELAPGLKYSVQVLDADTRQPLAGASLAAPDVPIVRTGADGWAHIEADRWSVYTVEVEGYEPDEWDPTDAILFDWGPVHLSKKP